MLQDGGVSKVSSHHVVFALHSTDTGQPLIASEGDKADILAFVTRLEFYLNTSHHWTIIIPPSGGIDIGWWGHRAALDDVFGGLASDNHATRMNDIHRTLTKAEHANLAKRRDSQIWSCSSNQIYWKSLKDIAFNEFQGGQAPIWNRALNCQSTKITMKRPWRLVDRMVNLTSLVSGGSATSAEVRAMGEMSSGLLSPGLGKSSKRTGSTVSVNEVDGDV